MRYLFAGLVLSQLLVGACSGDAGQVTGDEVDSEAGRAEAAIDSEVDRRAEVDQVAEVDETDQEVAEDSAGPDPGPADTTVIDPNGDSDGDGILDLDEIADGTDPFDPRSARAWHPEIVGHPRLFARPGDREVIAARAAADSGRAAILWQRVLALADRDIPEHPLDAGYDTSIPPTQARIAEAAALVGFATSDLSMSTKALEALAAPFPDPSPLNELSDFNAGDHYDLLEAEALAGFCSAYDLVAGTPGVDPEAVTAAAERLRERIDHFRALCMTRGGCATLLRNEPNNHAIKALAALGLCAMALPDRPEAAADFNEAAAAIDWLAHDKQGEIEGGWAESWNYLSYSGETHLGFLLALSRNLPAGTGAWRVRGEGWVTRTNPENGDDVGVLDPARDPLWRAVYRNALFATMPSGLMPPVDDANPAALHGGLLAELFDDGRFIWNWERPRVNHHTGRQLVATFLVADPTRQGVAPNWSDGFFADAGFSVLRSSLDEDASYLHVQHERGRMRYVGAAHEHADSLSFLLVARGTALAIDPGYIDFANHAKVKYAKDHNLVLVDGEGPPFLFDGIVDAAPSSDAYLHDHEVAPPFATLIASTRYAGALIERRFVRVTVTGGEEVFVVADRLHADGPRTWTFQLNGLASEEIADTSFELSPSALGATASWRRPQATLHAAITAVGEGGASSASRLEESALAGGRRHRCLTVDAEMGAGAGFVTALVPTAPDASPVITQDAGPGFALLSVALGDGSEVAAYLVTAGAVVVDGLDLEPGLTVVMAGADGGSDTKRWTMETPPIPEQDALP